MKKLLPIIGLCFLLVGCAEVRDAYKHDYLDVKPHLSRSRVKEITFLAERELLKSPYRDDYRIVSAEIDERPSEPRTHNYIFVHFDPLSFRRDIQETTFLVVFARIDDRILYSGIYTPPPGDPYYRFNPIVEKIEQ